ncbi:hypothetical protein HTG_17005 [Natrinema mahii]|nr:hypothetical protein HTG_17005 [Natrinema mahii]
MAPSNNKNPDDALGVDNTLTDVLGDHPKVRILAVLLSESRRDLNPSDIARLAGIERSTFYDHRKDLLNYGLIEETRTVGNSTMYQINKDSDAAQALGEFDHEVANVFLNGGTDDATTEA